MKSGLMKEPRWRWSGLLLVCLCSMAGDADTVRREFRQAWDAAERRVDATQDSAALTHYVLYPALQARRLRSALDATPQPTTLDGDIESFLETHDKLPTTRSLRRAWLLDLARRNEWARFFKGYRADVEDIELRCTALSGLIATQQATQAATQVVPLWLSANRLPTSCNAPFRWAQTNAVLTDEHLEQRVRLVLKAGNAALAKDLLGADSPSRLAPLRQWAAALDNPLAGVDALIANGTLEQAAWQDIWQRLARRDQDAALARIDRLVTARLDSKTASPYYLSLALALSWARRPEANVWFDKVNASDMNDSAWEWRARAALWQRDWTRVLGTIEAMPAALKSQARWRYWLARALEARNDTTAKARYEELVARDDNYYAALAAARLGVRYTPHPQPIDTDKALVKRLAALPSLERMREFIAVQLRPEANEEWFASYDNWNRGEQVAAITLAREWRWYERAILSAAKLGLFDDYAFLYPRPYDREVQRGASLSGLSVDLIYAQMRQESLFQPDARSTANAMGLMQLLPTTARQTARRAKLPYRDVSELNDPATNVPLGALELKHMLGSFDHLAMGLAAYNAGPNAVRRWLPEGTLDSDIWIENIPYNETRTYVQRIYWHRLIFQWLRSGEAVDTRSWLEPVQR